MPDRPRCDCHHRPMIGNGIRSGGAQKWRCSAKQSERGRAWNPTLAGRMSKAFRNARQGARERRERGEVINIVGSEDVNTLSHNQGEGILPPPPI